MYQVELIRLMDVTSSNVTLRMLYLRHFINEQLNLSALTPSEISPSGCYNFGMFHLRFGMVQLRAVTPLQVSPSGSYTFGLFTFGRLD